jgi:hypothetical protein
MNTKIDYHSITTALLQQFEQSPDIFFYLVTDEKFLDIIYLYKIDLSVYPTFNKQYTEFLESFL